MELGKDIFPKDAIARAKELYNEIGSIGAYSHSQGIAYIRKQVANFIKGMHTTWRGRFACLTCFATERDGYPSDFNHIFLSAGASAGVDLLVDVLISSPNSGILIPIPQYPLYTATLARHNGIPIPYYLDETSHGWTTNVDEVERAIQKALSENIETKALVIINPGNPTGGVLTLDEQKALVKLCGKYNIVLIADEVYQANIHTRDTHTFTSFKKVVRMLDSHVPLVSFHSISKGVTGDCGRRR